MPYPHPQIHRALRGACCRTVLRLPDVLRRALVSGRVLVLLALHRFHARRVRVHRRLPGEQMSGHRHCNNSTSLRFVLTNTTQRVRTLTEFRTMSITPYNVMAYRDNKWVEVISSELVPGDLVSVRESRSDNPRATYTRHLSWQSVQSPTLVSPVTCCSSAAPRSSTKRCFPANRLRSSKNLSSCAKAPTGST